MFCMQLGSVGVMVFEIKYTEVHKVLACRYYLVYLVSTLSLDLDAWYYLCIERTSMYVPW